MKNININSKDVKSSNGLFLLFTTLIVLLTAVYFLLTYHLDKKNTENKLPDLTTADTISTGSKSLADIEIEKLIDELGATLYKIDNETKCNLFVGYYYLNTITKDTAKLSELTRFLAGEIFQSSQKENSCKYPMMSAAFIYLNEYDCYNKENCLASCTITPDNYEGDVFVNTFLLNSKK